MNRMSITPMKLVADVMRKMSAVVAVLAFSFGCDGASCNPHRRYVLCDPLLRAPAICYTLENGWEGLGWIKWDATARNNQFLSSIILYNPKKHEVVQEMSAFAEAQFMMHQGGAIWQNANLMAQSIAQKLNTSVVLEGLGGFVAKRGRFSGDIPEKTRRDIEATTRSLSVSGLSHRIFKVECFFDCVYGGEPCEAKYEFISLFFISQPMPKLPAIAWSHDFETRFIVSPRGHMEETVRTGGRMMASAFVNRAWKHASERMMQAILTGKMIGANQGWELMKESQRNTAETMERIRKARSEQIREVKTVENPFSPGDKFERPAFFDHSWLNSREDTMILSDRTLEPNTIRGLMEMGDWQPID